MSVIKENLELIRSNIKEFAHNVKRSSEDITLIAVTKTVDVDKVLEAIEYGVTDVGENKPQELARKYARPMDMKYRIMRILYVLLPDYVIHNLQNLMKRRV